MDAGLRLRVQRYGWDKAADHYEQYWGRQLEPAQRRLLELADLQPCERVLDVACGTGLVTLPAAAAVGNAGSVLATDISEAMVIRVLHTAARLHRTNVRAERMDAQTLMVPDGSFDAALCSLGLMYIPNPLAALREMRRALRDGGRVAVAVWGARDRCGWSEVFPIVDAHLRSEICPKFFQLGTGDTLKATIEKAGFRDVGVERFATTLHYAAAADACGAAFAAGPAALAFEHVDSDVSESARREYLASIEPYRRGTEYYVPGEFVTARGLT